MDVYKLLDRVRASPLLNYGSAILLAVIALGVRMLAGGTLSTAPFITFFPAILISAYFGGRWSGALCAVVSGIFGWYYLLYPQNSFSFVWPLTHITLGAYAVVSLIAIAIVDFTARATRRAHESERARADLTAQLERRVEERTRQLRAEVEGRAEAEEKIAQYQRLEAVGQLVGGISHDFNNLLSVVIGNLDLAQRRLARGDGDVGRHIDAALDGAQRGAVLTQRLLAFARKQPLQPAVTGINALIDGMSPLLITTLGERITLDLDLAPEVFAARIDPAQLESAIVNLAVNARDAMPNGGRLTIETRNGRLDDQAGDYVVITVRDTGTGMPKAVADRAFEPFFTTKAVGHGTGLGLSQIYGYLKQSGGHAALHSEMDRGTSVVLYLPRYDGAEVAAEAQEATEQSEAMPRARDGETILVVEDEASLRAVTAEALHELGYRVLEAGGGEAALELVRAEGDLRLLFTDVVMPGMDGRELAEKAAALRPDLKTVFTTGYTRDALPDAGEGVEMLAKPFTPDQLARKIRRALDEA